MLLFLQCVTAQEETVKSGVLNMARMWETPARSMGGRCERWEWAWVADSRLVVRTLNRTTIVRRLDPSAGDELIPHIMRFYSARPDGGDYLVEDPWASLDLARYGFTRLWSLHFMVRSPEEAPAVRTNLMIREARSRAEMERFVEALVEGFDMTAARRLPRAVILDERVLADGALRCWIALMNGQPVGTAAAYVSDGVVGVYWISVIPSMRRQGVGEALTWQATQADHAPATLQATAMGRSLYERMGYKAVMTSATWIRTSRADIASTGALRPSD